MTLKIRNIVAFMALAIISSGCALPRAVAPADDWIKSASQSSINVVPITMASGTRDQQIRSFTHTFTAEQDATEALTAGDELYVVLVEGGGPELASIPTGRLDVTISISEDGTIAVPFAGTIPAAGRSLRDVERSLREALTGKLVDPQASVAIENQARGSISVIAPTGGVIQLDRYGARLSDALAATSLGDQRADSLHVTVARDEVVETVRLSDILSDPANDIVLRDGDRVSIQAQFRHATVLGAANQQGRIEILEETYSLMDLLGDARGLNDALARPQSLFLIPASSANTSQPQIILIDMTSVDDMIAASAYMVSDGDTLIVPNAEYVAFQKVLSVLSGATGAATAASASGN